MLSAAGCFLIQVCRGPLATAAGGGVSLSIIDL
jgi:hypothetical protein